MTAFEPLSKSSTDRWMLLWSGGVESTSVLKLLLETTDVQVVAHYVHQRNPEGRHQFELDAVSRLAERMQAIRGFEVASSTVEICGGNALGFDYEVLLPLSLVAMRHCGCSKLLRGWCAEDEWQRAQGRPATKPAHSGPRYLAQAECVRSLLRNGEQLADVVPYLQFYQNPKAWHVQWLGALAPLTWSCRRPVQGRECGQCHACLERAAAFAGTSAIAEVAEMLRTQDAE
jgi:7-cyano-7-deazaguanine synthase in queuosine biosynthesis